MWRDLDRRARQLQLPYQRPEVYPFRSVGVGRIALVGAREGWCRKFAEAAFSLHWTQGLPMTALENVNAALPSAQQDPERVHALASSPEVKQAFTDQTNRALERGIFGSPSFVVGQELFWGDHRVEQAIACAAEAS